MPALTDDRAVQVADAIAEVCNDVKRLVDKLDDVLAFNSNASVDWAAGQLDDDTNLAVGAGGNLTGRDFSPAQVSNAVGSLAAIKAGLDPVIATHAGNLDQLARAFG